MRVFRAIFPSDIQHVFGKVHGDDWYPGMPERFWYDSGSRPDFERGSDRNQPLVGQFVKFPVSLFSFDADGMSDIGNKPLALPGGFVIKRKILGLRIPRSPIYERILAADGPRNSVSSRLTTAPRSGFEFSDFSEQDARFPNVRKEFFIDIPNAQIAVKRTG